MPKHKRNCIVITQIYDGDMADAKWKMERTNFSTVRRCDNPALVWRMDDLQGTQRWTNDDEVWLKNQLTLYKKFSRSEKRQMKTRAYHFAFGGFSKEMETRRLARHSLGTILLVASAIVFVVWLACLAYSAFVLDLHPVSKIGFAIVAVALFLCGFILLRRNQRTLSWCQRVYAKQLRYDVLWGELNSL